MFTLEKEYHHYTHRDTKYRYECYYAEKMIIILWGTCISNKEGNTLSFSKLSFRWQLSEGHTNGCNRMLSVLELLLFISLCFKEPREPPVEVGIPTYTNSSISVIVTPSVFHTEGGVPWDFPPLTLISPLKFLNLLYTSYYFLTPMASGPLSICLRNYDSVWTTDSS